MGRVRVAEVRPPPQMKLEQEVKKAREES